MKAAGVPADQWTFTGPAKVTESQEEAVDAILGGRIQPGDVVVVRYEGPKGGPGMAAVRNGLIKAQAAGADTVLDGFHTSRRNESRIARGCIGNRGDSIQRGLPRCLRRSLVRVG